MSFKSLIVFERNVSRVSANALGAHSSTAQDLFIFQLTDLFPYFGISEEIVIRNLQ